MFHGESEFKINILHGQSITIFDIVDRLKIPREEVGFATRNNVKCNLDVILQEEDRIKIYPLIIGG